jgi:transposase
MSRKVKYDYEFKLHCVKEVLNRHRSIKSVSSEKGIHESNLYKWIMFYQKDGKKGLMPRQNQWYSLEFKLEVLRAIEKDHLSLSQACLRFNTPSDSILIKWQRDYKEFGTPGLESKPRGRPKTMIKRKKRKSDKPLTREQELLQENEALRAENALLKKLQALIQAEENKKRKP